MLMHRNSACSEPRRSTPAIRHDSCDSGQSGVTTTRLASCSIVVAWPDARPWRVTFSAPAAAASASPSRIGEPAGHRDREARPSSSRRRRGDRRRVARARRPRRARRRPTRSTVRRRATRRRRVRPPSGSFSIARVSSGTESSRRVAVVDELLVADLQHVRRTRERRAAAGRPRDRRRPSRPSRRDRRRVVRRSRPARSCAPVSRRPRTHPLRARRRACC